MKKQMINGATIATIASVLLMANAMPFAGADTASIRYSGQSADASWYSDNNGTYTDVFVFATDSATRDGSTQTTDNGAYVGVYQYTIGNKICSTYNGQQFCYNQYIPQKEFFGYATVQPASFLTQGRLEGATLSATIPGHDYLADSAKSITATISWTGNGNYSSGKSTYQYQSGEYSYHENYIGTWRPANASGSISGDIAMDLGNSTYGSLYDAQSGYVDIYHN